MHNIVRTREFNARGISSRIVRDARSCCLLQLHRGVYSIIDRCDRPEHARIREFNTDEHWIAEYGEVQRRQKQNGCIDFAHRSRLAKLRISSFPDYRGGDVIWGVSAAIIHDLPLYRPPTGLINVVHPTARRKGASISRTTRTIPRADQVRVGKMVLTSPLRTSFDLIGQLGERAGFVALEFAMRRTVFGSEDHAGRIGRYGYPPDTPERVDADRSSHFIPVLDRLTGARSRANRLLEHVGALSESYAESCCKLNLIMLGVEGFIQQVTLRDHNGRGLVRPDFLDPRTKTVIFVDGDSKYAANGFALMQKEARQHNMLVSNGYTVIRMRFEDVMDLERFATKLFGEAPRLRRR